MIPTVWIEYFILLATEYLSKINHLEQ